MDGRAYIYAWVGLIWCLHTRESEFYVCFPMLCAVRAELIKVYCELNDVTRLSGILAFPVLKSWGIVGMCMVSDDTGRLHQEMSSKETTYSHVACWACYANHRTVCASGAGPRPQRYLVWRGRMYTILFRAVSETASLMEATSLAAIRGGGCNQMQMAMVCSFRIE